MQRNINNYIAEYQQKFASKGKGVFYSSDLRQLLSSAQEQRSYNAMFWRLAGDALAFGFMVGYKAAKREEAKKRAAIRQATNCTESGKE